MSLKLYNNRFLPFFPSSERDFDPFGFGDFLTERQKQTFPACDFHEDKEHYFLSFDLPGLKKENLRINYENKVLTVSGTREEEYKEEKKDKQFGFVEKFYGSFKRSLTLPLAVDAEKISAHFENGVLDLVIPKSHQDKGREIRITEGKKESGAFTKLLNNKKSAS